jgi:hypothetical protein
MADTSAGFRYRERLCGQPPTIQTHTFKDSETLTKGDLLNLESGEVDLAATDDKLLLGVALETKVGVDSTTNIAVIVDEDAIYGVYDASARVKGAHLDLAGATGAMTVAADSNHDLMVFANSSAAEETLVMISHGAHVNNVTVT